MRKTKVKIPLYCGDLIIIQTNNFKKIETKYNLHLIIGYEAIVFKDHKNGYTRYVMVFNKTPTPSVIAHEALHVVCKVFYDRNMELDNLNDEAQCFLLEWVVNKCHKFLKVDDSKLKKVKDE